MSEYKTNVFRTAPDDRLIVLLEIEHPLILDKIRLVQTGDCDGKTIVSKGFDYIPCGFSFTVNKDVENEVPTGNLSVTNIGKKLMTWVEQSIGGKDGKVKFIVVRAFELDKHEDSHSFKIGGCNVSVQTIDFDLIVQSNLSVRGTRFVFDTVRARGLY